MDRQTRQRLMRNLPLIGGGAGAALTALFFLILPDWRLESAVSASGLPAILPFAQPPLGGTARALLMLAGAAGAGAVVWAALFLIWGPGGLLYRAPDDDRVRVRRADAHPDAPPRRPMSAAELGVPPPPSERPIPTDLDQPLAAFHPAAIPDVPLEPVRAVPSLVVRDEEPAVEPDVPAEPDAPAEPTVAVEPMPVPPPGEPAPVAVVVAPADDAGEPSIEALLQRLEAGARRKDRRPD